MIVNTIMFNLIGGFIMLIGVIVFEPTSMKKNNRSMMKTLFGLVVFVAGLAIVIGAHINLFNNGTTEEIVKYMFWFGGN